MKMEPPKSALTKMKELCDELERWEPYIRRAIRHGRDSHSFDDIVQMIMANRVFFYSFEDSFTIMEVTEYPAFKVFHCFLAGGELKNLLNATAPMAQTARALGCKYLSISGREGWKKVLSERGWKHICTTMYLPVETF